MPMTPEEMMYQQAIAQMLMSEQKKVNAALEDEHQRNQILGPEALKRNARLGTVDLRRDRFQDQLAQARAFGKPSGKVYDKSPVAAGLGAFGDLFRGITGGLQERSAQGDLQGLIDEQNAGKETIDLGRAEMLRRKMAKRPGTTAPGDASLLEPLDGQPESPQAALVRALRSYG